mmetsp:Transcript_23784/g.47664  ORF Transcript_23784/g.47664 Transcript_23784/m.47664 type:complete len:854 (+) Transcript_23784:275-2836(+)
MSRVVGRVPLRPRNVNVEKGNSSMKSNFLPPKKQDSRTFERQQSCASAELSNNDNNKGFSSISSDTLRRAISSGSMTSSNHDNGNTSTNVETGQFTNPSADHAAKKAPKVPSLRNISASNCTDDVKNMSAESVTIIEHRKRPYGDGHTVHKYLRGKLLGKGGFAKVYKVTSLDTNKEYAVKIVPKANLVKTRARQKLQTEIKIHRTMKHANICEYKHYFEDKTNCYILLELCHNQSINEMIKRRKKMTEEETRYFMAQIIEAVSFMHESNVIHRDLKLGNLFLNKNMNIKVGDFGLATRVDSSDEKRKTICGTPNYIAPEVIDGNKERRGHSFEVDVWSMGVICFTMLVGKPPYEASDVKSTYRRILANDYSFPQEVVSTDARDLISSMLQTDPKMRPTLEEMRNHPFFVHGKIPSAIPSSCTISAPIWSVDEFGELYAAKPTSALDIDISRNSNASVPPKQENALKRIDNVVQSREVKSTAGKLTNSKSAAPKAKFSIYDDVEDHLDSKPTVNLASTNNVILKNGTSTPATALATSCNVTTPVNNLTDKLSEFCFDEAREMPPEPSHSDLHNDAESKTSDEKSSQRSEGSKSSQSESTPKSRQISDDLHELELMHNRLNECLDNFERIQNGGATIAPPPLNENAMWGATKWVTRYVDYTSKYGLGFLLNDGSSGVYFNDSTKAVLSSANDDFVYIERKKSSAEGIKEPVSEYTLQDYPDDLKKKVTLLQHFRSYLSEQQKRAEEAGEVAPLSSNFGDKAVSVTNGMVFMKKWSRTKHAMLFRLSNGTVQVLFYDLTEVLISSEGKLITYVDKEKNRFVHTIEDIANKQQYDVSKRLKYAKEILSQLISGSKR